MNRNSNIAAANDTISIDTIPDSILKPRYECNNKGVFWIGVKTSRDGEVMEQEPIRLADAIELIGNGIDANSDYYRIIHFRDRLSRQNKTVALPMGEIGSNACWQRLQALGLFIASGKTKREKLADYLQEHGSKTPYHVTNKAGWHGNAYILPSGEVIPNHTSKNAQRIIYNGDKSQAAAYTPAGTLEEWQQNIAQYAAGNSRLCLALGIAFAAPLLSLLHAESGGFHLFGDSSDGKTTAALVALSVWGKPSDAKITWRGTGLGFSNIAAARNDGLLVLDEMGQAKAKVIGDTVYGIMNGVNKVQGAKQGGNRHTDRWRILVLSTGEKTPDAIMGKYEEWHAGQNTRLPSIPAYTGKGHGIYDSLHHFANGAELSEHLQDAVEQQHGTAGRAFINLIDEHTPAQAREIIQAFMNTLPPLSGQARRVAQRFALVAAAIELAAPITGLMAGVGMMSVKQCFDDWLERNGTGKMEDERIIEQAIAFMQQHAKGMRFIDWNDKIGTTNHDHAGYCKRKDKAELDEWWIIPIVFEQEICKTFDTAKVCTVLHGVDWLQRPSSEKGWKQRKYGQGRFYVLVGMMPPHTSD